MTDQRGSENDAAARCQKMPFALYNTNDEVDTLAESMDTPTVEKPAESAQPAPAGKPSAAGGRDPLDSI